MAFASSVSDLLEIFEKQTIASLTVFWIDIVLFFLVLIYGKSVVFQM